MKNGKFLLAESALPLQIDICFHNKLPVVVGNYGASAGVPVLVLGQPWVCRANQ